MNDKCYIVAIVHGVYMVRKSKPYTSKNGAIKEFKRQMKDNPNPNLKILQAQWVDADFDYKEDN